MTAIQTSDGSQHSAALSPTEIRHITKARDYLVSAQNETRKDDIGQAFDCLSRVSSRALQRIANTLLKISISDLLGRIVGNVDAYTIGDADLKVIGRYRYNSRRLEGEELVHEVAKELLAIQDVFQGARDQRKSPNSQKETVLALTKAIKEKWKDPEIILSHDEREMLLEAARLETGKAVDKQGMCN